MGERENAAACRRVDQRDSRQVDGGQLGRGEGLAQQPAVVRVRSVKHGDLMQRDAALQRGDDFAHDFAGFAGGIGREDEANVGVAGRLLQLLIDWRVGAKRIEERGAPRRLRPWRHQVDRAEIGCLGRTGTYCLGCGL